MRTLCLSVKNRREVQRSGKLLREGELVAFPTETVYGLGGRADDSEAVEALYSVKNRPREKKCAILIPDPDDISRYVQNVEKDVERLAHAFWPGSLTLVIGEDDSVGIRCPDCEPTRDMLRAAGVPVYAPSANPSGEPPARDADAVLEYFDERIAAVLDGGEVRGGIPSTVVRLVNGSIDMLREGALSRKTIIEVLRDGNKC